VLPAESSESTSGPPSPDRKPASALTPAILAVSFTVIAVQIQTVAAEGGVHSLLPILIAALLTLAGLAGRRSDLGTKKFTPWSA
jgi:hypothetical protein